MASANGLTRTPGSFSRGTRVMVTPSPPIIIEPSKPVKTNPSLCLPLAPLEEVFAVKRNLQRHAEKASVARSCLVSPPFFALARARRFGSLLPPHGMAGDGSHVRVAASVALGPLHLRDRPQ